jgi:predicted amidohydrolase
MIDNLKIAVCQMTSIDDAKFNLFQIEKLLDQTQSQGGADIAFFPENCLYMRVIEGEKISGFSLNDAIFKDLQNLAAKYKTQLHLGSIPLRMEGKLYNSSVLVSADKVTPTYQKVHLFDITLAGEKPVRESDVFTHGRGPHVLKFEGWNLGQTICYDIRFSELFHHYAKMQVDAILTPSAFLVKTGQAHWEILLRARAIESQCYIVAPAQAGLHKGQSTGQRETYGRSMVIDPWGQVIWEAATLAPEAKVLELSHQDLEKIRRQIPMSDHRRI